MRMLHREWQGLKTSRHGLQTAAYTCVMIAVPHLGP
jgi:hypothetical protein